MSDAQDRISQLHQEIEEARAMSSSLDEPARKMIDVGIKQMEKEVNSLQEDIDRENEYEKLEKLEEGGHGSMFRAAADVFQFDHWYVEDVEEFERHVREFDRELAKLGYTVTFTKIDD